MKSWKKKITIIGKWYQFTERISTWPFEVILTPLSTEEKIIIGKQMFNPFTPKSDLIDFTLSNARRFYSSKGDPLGVKGLNNYLP